MGRRMTYDHAEILEQAFVLEAIAGTEFPNIPDATVTPAANQGAGNRKDQTTTQDQARSRSRSATGRTKDREGHNVNFDEKAVHRDNTLQDVQRQLINMAQPGNNTSTENHRPARPTSQTNRWGTVSNRQTE